MQFLMAGVMWALSMQMSWRAKLLMKTTIVIDTMLHPRKMLVGALLLCVIDGGRRELSVGCSVCLGLACHSTCSTLSRIDGAAGIWR